MPESLNSSKGKKMEPLHLSQKGEERDKGKETDVRRVIHVEGEL